MKKKLILKHLPNVKEFAKRETELIKLIPKLHKELGDTQEILADIQGVSLHEDFPVKVTALADGHEVTSGCDEVKRSAFVAPATNGNKFVVTTAVNIADEGTPLEGEHKKADALRLAKDWVANGKKEAAVTESKKRGRPKKV